MKKIKSPWYGVVWIFIWTIALIWFIASGMFDQRESVGLVIVWIVLVGVTLYVLLQNFRLKAKQTQGRLAPSMVSPSLNSPCPCGSGKKYKRCCKKTAEP
jgi:TRAP-type C4-dicarboxylate transport system permease large subunit